ncbi:MULTISPECIES: hypothetical protein [unclassified Corallococcus]|uniref:hypothetical protein n=1 Tax=unclassified Corallococcus TaxID=2685029 RepID=UPI001A8E1043|nr:MULTISPECIES: hypothetical protein [unclassified Corallococcus]MBN9687096.1 hypothetical protein [Corallococcus sp. NCSPR001]WAS89076.1 hypothetical protein O0N60_19340 [Corallococcus sp. NCRR]
MLNLTCFIVEGAGPSKVQVVQFDERNGVFFLGNDPTNPYRFPSEKQAKSAADEFGGSVRMEFVSRPRHFDH